MAETINDLGFQVHIRYAEMTEFVEGVKKEFGLDKAQAIPPHVQIVDTYARPNELQLLLGVAAVTTPWAVFVRPLPKRTRRRPSFTVARVAPSLGTLAEQIELENMVENTDTSSPDELREKTILLLCFGQINKLNEWLSHIIGRVGQFLQG